jgi:hypothetical protein
LYRIQVTENISADLNKVAPNELLMPLRYADWETPGQKNKGKKREYFSLIAQGSKVWLEIVLRIEKASVHKQPVPPSVA